MSRRPDEPVILSLDEAVVLLVWLERELAEHDGREIAAAIEHPAELVSLFTLLRLLSEVVQQTAGPSWDRSVMAAREVLTPRETFVPIDPAGSESRQFATGAPIPRLTVRLNMPAADTLVLFEFLCREIDERDGSGLIAAFVSPAEFWALNALQCVLEKGEFYAVTEDYARQLDSARLQLLSRHGD